MKILYATSEAYPFAMSGGLADVSGALPKAFRRRLVGCRVVMPLYAAVPQELREKMTFLTSITVPVAWRRQYCGIFEARLNGVIYYLLDNQYYFNREGLYGHYDDAERFAFFSRAVLEIIPYIDYKPQIIHCNDWQTALIPVYLKSMYAQNPAYTDIKTLFTIHNIQYQGKYSHEIIDDVFGVPWEHTWMIEYDGCVNLMKGAIECADFVNTVSPTYANEIKDPWYSHGLDNILKLHQGKLCGILNGIDTEVYDPQNDPHISAAFSADNFADKAKNKQALQKELGLPCRGDLPLFAVVSRLVEHKGFDLVKAVFEDLLKADIQFAVLGTGEWQYESFFEEMAAKYPNKVVFRKTFNFPLSHRFYAGADFFLMPSKSEPCGLSQMIALRYGTLPIVRQTGGLNDTISDCGDGKGNGFTFASYNAHDMLDAIWRALSLYSDTEKHSLVLKRAMECDNSWGKSASVYINLYKSIIRGLAK